MWLVTWRSCDCSCDWYLVSCDCSLTYKAFRRLTQKAQLLGYITEVNTRQYSTSLHFLWAVLVHRPQVPTLERWGGRLSPNSPASLSTTSQVRLPCQYLQPPSYWPWTLAFCLRFCLEQNQTDSLVFQGSWFTSSPWPCPRAALTDTCAGGTAGGTEDDQLGPEEGRAGGEATTCSGGEGTQVPEGAWPWAQVPSHGCLYQHHEDHKEEGLILTRC